jgi:PHD/YefM family antitoxin component YafN of YafNO toxin-antitoxin module
MVTVHPQYISDSEGKKISVILPLEEYNVLMEELEELEDIRLYDEAKKSEEPSVPLDDAFRLIESKRRKDVYE